MIDIKNYDPMGGRICKESGTTVNNGDKLEEFLGQKGMVVITDTAAHASGTGKCIFAFCWCPLSMRHIGK